MLSPEPSHKELQGSAVMVAAKLGNPHHLAPCLRCEPLLSVLQETLVLQASQCGPVDSVHVIIVLG